jgi:hypothetical protein
MTDSITSQAYELAAGLVSSVTDLATLIERKGDTYSTSDVARIVADLDVVNADVQHLPALIEAAKDSARALYDEKRYAERQPKAA